MQVGVLNGYRFPKSLVLNRPKLLSGDGGNIIRGDLYKELTALFSQRTFRLIDGGVI